MDPIFVVQEHHATHLHYDFRIEIDGVLKSWAVPKGVPTEAGVKRLAIEVEDHDLAYADYENEEGDGNGKGIVKTWDRGTYKIKKRNEKEYTLTLAGNKLKGDYYLYSFGKVKNRWLVEKGRGGR